MVAVRELLTPLPGSRAENEGGRGGCSLCCLLKKTHHHGVFTERLPALRGTNAAMAVQIDFSVDGNDPLSSLYCGKLRTYDMVQVAGSI